MSRKPAQRAGLTEHEDLINALVAEIKDDLLGWNIKERRFLTQLFVVFMPV